MKLLGYIKPYSGMTFSIPVYGNENSYYCHELGEDFIIEEFVQVDIDSRYIIEIDSKVDFQIGNVAPIIFIDKSLRGVYGPLNEISLEIIQMLSTADPPCNELLDELYFEIKKLDRVKRGVDSNKAHHTVLRNLLDDIIERKRGTFDILVLKGFKNELITDISKLFKPVGDDLPIGSDNRIFLRRITDSFLDILSSLKSVSVEAPGILMFESLSFLSKEINLDQLKRKFLIIENNLIKEYPNQSDVASIDFEKAFENGNEIQEDDLFSLFYSNAVEKGGQVFIQYIDGIIEDFQCVKKAYLIEENPYPIIKPITIDELSPKHILLQPFQETYYDLKNNLSESYRNEMLLFVYEKASLTQREARIEINLFLNFLSQAKINCEVYELDQRLSLNYRPELTELLQKHWQSSNFRTLKVYKDPDTTRSTVEISQGAIVEEVIAQFEAGEKGKTVRDILLTAPTGAGKSLLFQMPAFYLASRYNAVTIVISPLIALMKDQVQSLKGDRHYDGVAYINSELSLIERGEIIKGIYSSDISIIYMSPELLLSYDLSMFIGQRRLGLLVVDEAHLVTTWGRDFRVDYWYLGNFIRKIRKYQNHKFPVLAVTATAVYNGPNDMVFETLDSLSLENAIMYIGKVRRDEIEFKLSFSAMGSAHEKEKVFLTAKRIQELIEANEKTIVYCPWTSQLTAIKETLDQKFRKLTGLYFGGLDKDIKDETYLDFKSNRLKTIVSTKAFGMGVDIDDITVVYHHAPSGHLADYVQEIGRLARKPSLKGVAMMDFNPKDLKFTKILYGLSSIKQYQVQLVLDKITKIYDIKKKRNLLVSIEDFEYIFNFENIDVEQKVKSSLLLIEKDLLTKYRYNVLIARPKSLFTTVFVRLKESDQTIFLGKYGEFCTYLHNAKIEIKGMSVYRVELDKLWEKHYSDMSFPLMKKKYFDKTLFSEQNFDVTPQLKMSIHLDKPSVETFDILTKTFEMVEASLASFQGGFFKKQDFFHHLAGILQDRLKAKRIADLILSIYSSPLSGIGAQHFQFVDPECFIQQKRQDSDYVYRVISRSYPKIKSSFRSRFERMFGNMIENSQTFFLPINDTKNTGMIKMAYIIEAFDLGSYEISGGEKPGIFVRLNDPFKLKKMRLSGYKNHILEEIDRRQKTSVKIMEYFFGEEMSNQTRWDFIESYFLGVNMEDLGRPFSEITGSNPII